MCSEDWPASGMLRDGCVYPLPTSVRPTGATGSGSWLTARANEDAAGRPGANMQVMLSHQARLFQAGPPAGPTPLPSGAPTASPGSCPAPWGTPRAADGMNRSLVAGREDRARVEDQAANFAPPKGKLTLNPAFVAWLMGWPRNSALLTLPWGKRK